MHIDAHRQEKQSGAGYYLCPSYRTGCGVKKFSVDGDVYKQYLRRSCTCSGSGEGLAVCHLGIVRVYVNHCIVITHRYLHIIAPLSLCFHFIQGPKENVLATG